MRTHEQLHQAVMELHHGLQVEGLHALTDEQVRALILDLDELHLRVINESMRRGLPAQAFERFSAALYATRVTLG